MVLTDGSGNTVNRYAYDSFGNVTGQEENLTGQAPAAAGQPFKFVGQFGVMTEPDGFYYMRARYYDSQVGRFVSEDPIGFDGGDVNLYGYVGNNPVMGVDPGGFFNVLLGGGVSAKAPTGGEASVGVVFNPGFFGQKADIGVFGSVGGSGGVNVSADAFIGFVRGGMENVRGTTANINLTAGPLSLTVFVDPKNGDIMGGTVGLGPGATPIGASGSIVYTGTATARDLFTPAPVPTSQSRGCGK